MVLFCLVRLVPRNSVIKIEHQRPYTVDGFSLYHSLSLMETSEISFQKMLHVATSFRGDRNVIKLETHRQIIFLSVV